jgi:hypothetical protein
MHPVESRTGAIRLEDSRQGAMWLQLGNKSMLMDQKLGERVADDCEAQEQKDFVAHEQEHPQEQLFNAPVDAQPSASAQQNNAPVDAQPGASDQQKSN